MYGMPLPITLIVVTLRYGARWAQAATAPSRLHKMFSTEGGVRVPLIMKLPGWAESTICKEFCTVMDIMPTLLDLAGVRRPGKVYNGRAVASIRGESWCPYFQGRAVSVHSDDYVVGWELVGQAALRKGVWKINFVAQGKGPEVWQLYDLSKDPGETIDLALQYPDKLTELVKHWQEYALETGVVGLKPDLGVLVVRDEMLDPTRWMQFDTSYAISRALKSSA